MSPPFNKGSLGGSAVMAGPCWALGILATSCFRGRSSRRAWRVESALARAVGLDLPPGLSGGQGSSPVAGSPCSPPGSLPGLPCWVRTLLCTYPPTLASGYRLQTAEMKESHLDPCESCICNPVHSWHPGKTAECCCKERPGCPIHTCQLGGPFTPKAE